MPNIKWTYSDKNYVKANAHTMTDEEIAQKLSGLSMRLISVEAVRQIRYQLGIKKNGGQGKNRLEPPKKEQ